MTKQDVNTAVKAILATGFAGAVLIYFTAPAPAANALGYEFRDSKSYLRNMEMFGGKANLLSAEFREWLAGMFQGQSLAYTVAFLSVVLALGVWLFATPLPPAPPGGGTGPE
jgi:hypothetical protein